ncbi:hypothetical protein Bca52824_029651 [Brassica carinata]|uniref:Uncharacterized protein n=1 Tax=Brassica carinata TaxID=52824 RepID=A0A8X7S959_BRACI|nr:hypothetical protein Bca52824_029651 [Brassica carinata]
MANAGAVSGSCWPELINTVFFYANATLLDSSCAQLTRAALCPGSSSVFDWLSMSPQVSCLGR